jgi:hypothetical protein
LLVGRELDPASARIARAARVRCKPRGSGEVIDSSAQRHRLLCLRDDLNGGVLDAIRGITQSCALRSWSASGARFDGGAARKRPLPPGCCIYAAPINQMQE